MTSGLPTGGGLPARFSSRCSARIVGLESRERQKGEGGGLAARRGESDESAL